VTEAPHPYVAHLLRSLSSRLAEASAAAVQSDGKLLGRSVGAILGVVDELMERGVIDPADVRWARKLTAPYVRAAFCDADRRAA
jgi:hypothetical protein